MGWVLALVAGCGGGGAGPAGDDGSSSYQAGPGPKGGAALYADFRTGKKLVLHQRGLIAVSPARLRDALPAMEAALDAYDGVFLRLPNSTDAVTRATTLAASVIADDLQPLYALQPTRLRYNFAIMSMRHDLDPFDDWTVALRNVSSFAKVARDAGLVGIVIDNEDIAGLRVNYPYDLKSPNKTIEEYRAQMQLISKKIMQAIVAEFPDAAVVVLRGPAGAEPASPANLVNREVDSAQLIGPFFAGFVEGKGARSLVVDGGTDYALRTAEQFDASRAWRQTGIASAATDSAFIPAALRAVWPASVNVSHGVRELDGSHGNLLPNDPALWANTVRVALENADTFVWASFDFADMTTASAASTWPTAARRAKVAAGVPTATLGSTTPSSGTGLMAQYYSQIDESELAQTVVDPTIDNVWTGTGPTNTLLSQTDNFSVVWSGYIEATTTGTYTIIGTTDDGMQILIGGTPVVDAFYFQGPTEHSGTIDLVAGQRYPIKIRYFQGGGETEAHVEWQPPGGMRAPLPTAQLYPVN
ncbi:MAG: PA14 domain-containing protein [Caldimonas sp.]